MKKALSVILVMMLAICSIFAQSASESAANKDQKTLTVYAYDTFCGDWGAASAVIPAFEEATGIKVNLVSAGAAIEVINKVRLEGANTRCDVILGITDDLAEKAYDLLESYNSPNISNIDSRLIFDPQNRLIPYDYGAFAFVYDTEAKIELPTCLEDLKKDIYKDKVILIDPRTSSVGTGLLMWTYNALGEGWKDWWKTMSKNALTTASGWSSGYGLFTEGEAPIVISYTTSPVYHVMWEDTTRYQALLFTDGHEVTIEAAGIVKGTKHRQEAEAFIDFLLTQAQIDLANANSMYPANTKLELPPAYDFAPVPEKIYTGSSELASTLVGQWTDEIVK
ncbi:MAG: thiamine ABC transporter substrate-binding protein [Spirochaetales bacterium]|nr:thiamine ABC transporter substrate-binding protein [Spirochaetales bacterium]